MRFIPSAKTWNGIAINDGVTLKSYFPESSIMLGPSGTPVINPRAYHAPEYATTVVDPGQIPLHIIMLGDIPTQSDYLRGIFNALANQSVQFVITNTDDSTDWYYTAIFRKFESFIGAEMVALIDIPDMVRTKVTQSHQQALLTASGQTISITPGGNARTQPIMTFTPTSAKAGASAGSFAEGRFITHRNSITTPLVAYPFDLTESTPGTPSLDTVALVNDTTTSNQINQVGGINAVVTTIPIDTPVGIGLPTAGMGYVDTEQIAWTANSGTSLTGVTRGVGGTTAAVHADNAVIALSHVQKNGNDLRVYVDGTQVDRWLVGMFTTTTKIWINTNLPTRTEFTLRTAIAGAGNISSIDISFPNTTYGSAAAFNALPTSGILRIDNEVFTYAGRTANAFTNISRATKRSALGAHSVGATVYYLPHDVWLYYGDPSSTAQITNDAVKPIIDLSASTNISWVYNDFFEDGAQRSAAVSFPGGRGNNTSPNVFYYTAPSDAIANPATAIGLLLTVYKNGTKYYFYGNGVVFSFYVPVGISTVTITGQKRRVGTAVWLSVNAFASAGASGAYLFSSESAPASGAGFVALDVHSAITANGATNLQITAVNNNGNPAAIGNLMDIYFDSVTLALVSANVSVTSIAATNSQYDFTPTITNQTTGDSISFRQGMALAAIETINGVTHKLSYSVDGSAAPVTLNDQSRFDWLPLLPGVANVLRLDDPGLTGMTWDVYWNDRDM